MLSRSPWGTVTDTCKVARSPSALMSVHNPSSMSWSIAAAPRNPELRGGGAQGGVVALGDGEVGHPRCLEGGGHARVAGHRLDRLVGQQFRLQYQLHLPV